MVTKVAVNLEMQATGLKSATDQASKLNAELASAQGNAAKTSKALAAAKQASRPVGAEYTEYGRGRAGREGGTGASARDFANQAQGLGGLVRLYATYAANIFAVGAAFNALSAAMDTTNMIKGLNQLGAASGTALGSLSKELVNATDGAVSLREAMEATVKASSSGMSNKDIIRMGEAAQKASLALGVNMSDALSRMSRGITKLEPELLDELGIFVRVDDAAAEYAKSVGKAASELTGFERRMAFANATLEQAEKKFGAIDIESNPYTQLLAELKNFAQVTGEVLNVALVPLVKLLSSSPLALSTVLGGMTMMLLKQAIPAFGQLRESMEAAVNESADLAQQRLADFQKVEAQRRRLIEEAAEARAETEIEAVNKAEQKLKSFDKTRLSKTSELAQNILDQSLSGVDKVSEKQLKKLDSVAKGLETKGNAKEAALYREITGSIRSWKAAEEERYKVIQRNKEEMESAGKASLNYVLAERARNAAISQSIVSNTAYIGSTNGISAAIRTMNKDISEAGLTGFQKFKTQAVGTFAAIAGRIGTVMSYLSGFMVGIGVVIAAIGVLDMVFSKASKEVKEFNNTVDKAIDVAEGFGRTMSAIYKDTTENLFDTKALKAYGMALQEIADTASTMGDKFTQAREKMSWWDKMKDSILGVFNADMADDYADGMTEMLSSAMKNVKTPKEAAELRSKIAEALNISTSFTSEDLNAALEKAADSNNIGAMQALSKAIKSVATEAQIAASKVEDFEEALKGAKESYKEFADQYKVKDPTQKLGESIIAMSSKLAKAFEDPKVALQQFAELSKDTQAIALFAEQDQQNLIKYGSRLQELAKQQDEYTRKLEQQKQKASELQKQLANEAERTGYIAGSGGSESPLMLGLQKQIDAQKQVMAQTQSALSSISKESKFITSSFEGITGRSFAKGADLIATSIRAAGASASAEITRGLASGISGWAGAADLQAKAAKADLSAKMSLIEVQLALIKATHANTQAIKLDTLAKEKQLSMNLEPGERARFGVRSPDAIEADMQMIKRASTLVDSKNPAAEIKNMAKEAQNASPTVQAIANDVLGVLQSMAGLRNETAKLGAQAKIIELNKKAGNIAEQSANREKEQKAEILSVDTAISKLKTLEATNKVLTDAERAELDLLEIKKMQLESDLAYDKLQAEIAQKSVFLAELEKQNAEQKKRTNKDDDTYLKTKQSKELDIARAEQERQLREQKIAEERSKQASREYEIALSREKFRQETAELENSAMLLKEESVVKSAELQYQMMEASGFYSKEQLASHKIQVLRVQEEASLKRKMYEMELAYIRAVQDLITSKNNYTAEDIQARIAALYNQWQNGIAEATKESQDKITLEAFKVEQGAFADLKAGLSDAISTALFEGGEAGKKKLRDVIVAELKKPITLFINAMVNSLFSGGGAGGKNSPSNYMDMFSNVTQQYGKYVTQFGDLLGSANTSAFGTGMQLTATETTAAANAYLSAGPEYAGIAESLQAGNTAGGAMGTAGAYAGGVAAGIYGGRAISGGYSAIGGSSGNTAVNVGTAIGAFFGPLGAAVGGLIGGVVNRAFGKKLTETGYAAQFNKDGSITASNYEQYKGGWFSSDKTKRTEMDPAAKSALETQMQNLKLGAKGMAEMLGLGSEAIDSFTGEMRVNFKGAKDDAEKAKRVEEAYRKAKAQMLATAHINEAGHVKQKELEATQNSIREQAMRDAEMKIREASKETGKSAAEIEKDVSSASDKIEEAGSTALDNLTGAGTAMEDLSQEQLNNINMLRDAEKAKSKEFEDLTSHYVEVIKKADEAMASAGISAESLGSIIRDAMLGRISGEEAGQALSDQILDGIYNTIASGYANQIGAMIIEQIVQPMFVSIMQTGTISATVSQASIDATINTAMAAVNAFKQILDDPRFQAAMQQLSGAMSQIGKVAGSSAGSIRTRTSSMSYLNNRANEAAEAAKKRAEERLSLEKELLGILGDTNKLREIELRDIDASNRALKKQIWAIEDAKKGVEDAMSTLERSIEKRKEQLQEELDLATEARDMAKDVFDTLKDSIEDILGTSAKAMRVDEARKLISQAISTGILPDADKLSGAIDVLKDKVENDRYGSRADQKRASLRLANELKLLQGVAEPQLTEAEKQVKALEEQITKLDKQLEYAQQQVDALFGIDNSVLQVAVAVDRLNTAMTGYKSQINIGAGMVGSGKNIPGTYIPALPPDSPTAQWTADGYWKNNLDLRNMYNANSAGILSQYGSRDAYLQWHYENFGQAEGRKFKNGGSYLGGLAMVGENGPELINFKEPGMVYTAAQTRNLLDTNGMSEEEVALLRELVTEIKMMRYETQATAMHTNKTYRILDRVTKSGQAVQTQEVPPTP